MTKKPSERIKEICEVEIQDVCFIDKSTYVLIEAILKYLDEEWEKNER